MADIPPKSSGKLWSPAEDEQLRLEILDVVAKHEGRSIAAVLSRVELLRLYHYHTCRWPAAAPPADDEGEIPS